MDASARRQERRRKSLKAALAKRKSLPPEIDKRCQKGDNRDNDWNNWRL